MDGAIPPEHSCGRVETNEKRADYPLLQFVSRRLAKEIEWIYPDDS